MDASQIEAHMAVQDGRVRLSCTADQASQQSAGR
jgi:hypothetical protein